MKCRAKNIRPKMNTVFIMKLDHIYLQALLSSILCGVYYDQKLISLLSDKRQHPIKINF